jgi:lipopolysaccharide transport system ATP-binding protein
LPTWCKQMTADLAIQAENLGKLFPAAGRRAPGRLREAISESVHGALRKAVSRVTGQEIPRPAAAEDATFWALRHVCFQVRRGKVLGLLGANGAGKTTLLKILSRIVFPSEGRVEVRGSLGALLDAAAGLHGELTGRENIPIYGAVLGMTPGETKRKFDEIVSFAGVERFLDTPVKRYSTGMYSRLAFSVAAHLEADILLVDDILSVADKPFQKKCLEKMTSVAAEGRTFVLVSHEPGQVRRLCADGIVLSRGNVEYSGSAAGAADFYESNGGAMIVPKSLGSEETRKEL